MIRLSDRLHMNASFVTPGNRLADVGTDHAYVPIWLVQNQIIPFALAMDVNEGPLLRAEEHIRECGLEKYIDTRLSDGLVKLKMNEVDSILIAGMGGALTVRILQDGSQVLRGVSELILQPQSELWKVRRYLATIGFAIQDEEMVFEDGKFYTVIKAIPGEMPCYSEVEFIYGKALLQKQHPILHKYLLQQEKVQLRLFEQISNPAEQKERTRVRKRELEKQLEQIQEALRFFEESHYAM